MCSLLKAKCWQYFSFIIVIDRQNCPYSLKITKSKRWSELRLTHTRILCPFVVVYLDYFLASLCWALSNSFTFSHYVYIGGFGGQGRKIPSKWLWMLCRLKQRKSIISLLIYTITSIRDWIGLDYKACRLWISQYQVVSCTWKSYFTQHQQLIFTSWFTSWINF